MLEKLSEWLGTRIRTEDGLLGSVTDILINERRWTVEYFAVRLEDGQEGYLPTMEIKVHDSEGHEIMAACDSRDIIGCRINSLRSLVSWEYLDGQPVKFRGRTIGHVEDFRSADGSYLLDTVEVDLNGQAESRDATGWLFDIKRIRNFDRSGALRLADHHPYSSGIPLFSTPEGLKDSTHVLKVAHGNSQRTSHGVIPS